MVLSRSRFVRASESQCEVRGVCGGGVGGGVGGCVLFLKLLSL